MLLFAFPSVSFSLHPSYLSYSSSMGRVIFSPLFISLFFLLVGLYVICSTLSFYLCGRYGSKWAHHGVHLTNFVLLVSSYLIIVGVQLVSGRSGNLLSSNLGVFYYAVLFCFWVFCQASFSKLISCPSVLFRWVHVFTP